MTCTEFNSDLDAYIDGHLEQREVARFDAHLAACAICREDAREAREFSDMLRTRIQSVGNTLKAPPGAKEAALALCRHEAARKPRHVWRVVLGVAAMLVIGLVVFVAWYAGNTATDVSGQALRDEYVHLKTLQEWQDDIAVKAGKCGSDPALLSVACAYLPASKRGEVLQRLGKTSESLSAEWPERAELIVRLQRSSRKGASASELIFEQWSDGRVHVEHVVQNGEDSTTTKLDAGTWEILAAQNPDLCRQLELVDEHGALLAGLPIPSAQTLRRETLEALRDGGAAPDLAKRLLQLRLAPRVKSRAELETALRVETPRPTAPAMPQRISTAELQARVAELELSTAAGVKSVDNIVEAEAYFKKLCSN